MFGGPRFLMNQENLKPANPVTTLSRLGRYFGKYWFLLIITALLIIASTWTQVTSPELIGQAVDCYLTPAVVSRLAGETASAPAGQPAVPQGSTGSQGTPANTCWFEPGAAGLSQSDQLAGFARLILLVVGLYIGGAIFGGLMFYLMSWMGQHVLRNLREEVFGHLHRLSLGYYSENEVGNVMSRITNDMETIQQAISFALVNVVSGVLLIGWIAYNMLTRNLPYALLSMAVVPLMIVTTLWISGKARNAYRVTRQEIGRVNADLQESIAGVREVQAFGREDANVESFRQTNAANRDANITAVSYTAALSPALEALGYLALAIVTVVGGLVLLRGTDLWGTTITLGLMITFLNYVQRFNQPIQQIATLWASVQSAVAGSERIFGLLDTQPDVTDAPEARAMPAIQGEVVFDHVRAAYKIDEPVLNDVSFTARPGQTIAIVGPTGAGKTTIINLIPRFYDVTGGEIRIDGINIAQVESSSLRRQIGIVLQDTFLFSDTVMNNIRFGKPEANDEEVKAASVLAHADEFIQRLPDGYQTVLGEHGSGLSQGQRQLLAIARAALTDPHILILDEATSSVDTRTERLIQKALEKLLAGRTSFVIAHRLSTIRNADQVLVIEDGRIVESGVHAELLRKKGAYYDLYMRQYRPEDEHLVEDNGRQPRLSASGAD